MDDELTPIRQVFVPVTEEDMKDPRRLTDLVREAELQRMIEEG